MGDCEGESEAVERAGEGRESDGVAEAVVKDGAAETGAACRLGKIPDEVWRRLWTG